MWPGPTLTNTEEKLPTSSQTPSRQTNQKDDDIKKLTQEKNKLLDENHMLEIKVNDLEAANTSLQLDYNQFYNQYVNMKQKVQIALSEFCELGWIKNQSLIFC